MLYLDMNIHIRHQDLTFSNAEGEPVSPARHPRPVVQDRQHVPDVNSDHYNVLILRHQ